MTERKSAPKRENPRTRRMRERVLGEGIRLLSSEGGEAVTALLQHASPGNVRELQQMVRAAAALCERETITPEDLGLVPQTDTDSETGFDKYFDIPLTEARSQLVEDFERTVIRRALDAEADNVSAAARRLGIHRQSLQQKMKGLGIR